MSAARKLSPRDWADIIVQEAHRLGYKMTPRQVAEGLGVLQAENNFGPGYRTGAHIGPLAEDSSFGTPAERRNAILAVRAGLRRWKADGKSWWPAWGVWEKGETEGAGPDRYKKFLPTAEAALHQGPSKSSASFPALAPQKAPAAPSSPSGLGAELMHVGLVATLVLGGAAMVLVGGLRVLGVKPGAAA